MKKNIRERHAQSRTQAAVEFLKRFGFVLFVAIMFVMLTVAVAFSQKRESTVDKKTEAQTKISLGDSYMKQGNGGLAVSNYEAAAVLTPQDPLPHYKIGVVYLRSTNKDAAMEAFQKAVAVDPSYAPAYKELAGLYYTMKNGPEAVKMQEKYMQLEGSPDSELVRLGYYVFMTRDFAKANEVFLRAYQKGLLKDNGLRYYALSLFESGDYAGSQKVFEEYFSKAKPDEVEASDYTSYGKALLNLKQDSLAVIALQKALIIDNKLTSVKKILWETLYSLGKSYYSKQQFALADSAFENLIDLHPGVINGYLWSGRAKAQLDPETEQGLAKSSYEKVIEIGQATPDKSKAELKEAYSYMGYYYFLKNDAGQSRANWEKVLALDPQDAKAREALKAIRR